VVDSPTDPGFSPADLSDGREPGDWKTRYPDRSAQREIAFEAFVLGLLLIGIPILILLVWVGTIRHWLAIEPDKYDTVATFAYAWLAGALGGAAFSAKWLVHTVAKRKWNVDRRFWRIFTPIVAGTVAFALIALATSGLFQVLDAERLRTGSAVVGVSFLLGYFSDNTIAKLAELAERLLGERPTDPDGRPPGR
jgi:dipeptide/tripeptide permease